MNRFFSRGQKRAMSGDWRWRLLPKGMRGQLGASLRDLRKAYLDKCGHPFPIPPEVEAVDRIILAADPSSEAAKWFRHKRRDKASPVPQEKT